MPTIMEYTDAHDVVDEMRDKECNCGRSLDA